MRTLISFFFLIITLGTFSQNLQFRNYTAFDGLSTSKTSSIVKGTDGYMWVATDNGLNRFDGVNFKWFTMDINDSTSLPGNVVMSLLVDHNNTLWVSTDGGVCGYDKDRERFFAVPDKRLAETYCKSIIQDSKENYWAITGGVVTVYDKEWNQIIVLNDDPNDINYIGDVSFFCMAEDNNGLMWIGTQEKGFFSYDLTRNDLTSYTHLTEEKEIFSLFPDSKGNIWVATHDSPYIFDKELNQIYNLLDPNSPFDLPKFSMSHFFEDQKGNIIISQWTDGVTIYNPLDNTSTTYLHSDNDKSSFGEGSVEFGYQDDNGNYWFAGSTSGLTVSYANIRKINRLSDPDFPTAGVFFSPVTAITQDPLGNIWFGTDGGGTSIWNKETGIVREYKHVPEDTGSYGGHSVLTEFTDSRGRVWSGGYNSNLNLYNPENETFIKFTTEGDPPYQISGSDVRAITEDDKGNIWVATNGGGVNVYNPDTYQRKVLNVATGLPHNYCISIMNDQEGNIWIGSYGGLAIYNTLSEKISIYQKDEKDTNRLQSNWINTIFKDSKQRYWIGTQLGLAKFDPKTGYCQNYLEEDGIINHSIVSVEEDDQGNLWIGTMDGLAKFNPEMEEFINFNINDGLPDNQMRMGASFKSDDGILFFGTNKSVFYFNPKDIIQNPIIPEVRFTDLYVNNKLIEPGKSDILPECINSVARLKLKKNQNFITVNFAALSYYQAEKNTYRYILEGVDNDWTVTETNYASYTNLKHGKYVFKVQAFNNDGTPSEIKQLKVRITPKWYNTILFWVVLILGFIYFTYRNINKRKEQYRKNELFLEQKIKENEQKLADKIREVELKEEEILTKNDEEKELRFLHEGIAMFSDIISKNRNKINELSNQLVSELVKYVGATAGVNYLLDDSDPNNLHLIPTGSYCASIDLKDSKSIKPGEGYVGTCFDKKEALILDNLPDGYFVVSSGLVEASMRHCTLIPIVHEDNCLGVIELASNDKLEGYKIDLINKLSESFASAMAITKATEQSRQALEQNRIQAEELQAQDEEMRQNLEEMHATQEELHRQMEEYEKTQTALNKEKALMDALLNYSPDMIYFKDTEGVIFKASESMATNTNIKSLSEIIGKSDFDLYTEEHARPAFEDELRVMKTGKALVNKVETETHKDGSIKYVSTSKMPLRDDKGKCIGTFGISKNITEIKLQEKVYLQQIDKLKKQEIKLKAQLKEMENQFELLKANGS